MGTPPRQPRPHPPAPTAAAPRHRPRRRVCLIAIQSAAHRPAARFGGCPFFLKASIDPAPNACFGSQATGRSPAKPAAPDGAQHSAADFSGKLGSRGTARERRDFQESSEKQAQSPRCGSGPSAGHRALQNPSLNTSMPRPRSGHRSSACPSLDQWMEGVPGLGGQEGVTSHPPRPGPQLHLGCGAGTAPAAVLSRQERVPGTELGSLRMGPDGPAAPRLCPAKNQTNQPVLVYF